MGPHLVPVSEAGGVIAELERLSKKYRTQFRVESGEVVIHSGNA